VRAGHALGLGRHAILIAPGLFVKDRLLQDFFPPDHGVSVFWSDPVVPPELERFWDLKVYDPSTCPRQLDPDEGALVVTNYHQLLRTREEMEQLLDPMQDRQIQILFDDPDPEKLEAVKAPLLERFARSKGVLVLNDEAHHVWDEPGHAAFEEKAKQKAGATPESEDEAEAMAWIRSIRKLNGSETAPGRVGLQVDLSATLFQETGSVQLLRVDRIHLNSSISFFMRTRSCDGYGSTTSPRVAASFKTQSEAVLSRSCASSKCFFSAAPYLAISAPSSPPNSRAAPTA
jgi:hypothetical protein